MQVGYLGALEVRVGDRVVDVPGRRSRVLLGRLALDVGRAVPVGELVDAIWPDAEPADPHNALQSLVSRLRRTLGDPALVEQVRTGYRLVLDDAEVDAGRFRRLTATGARALAEGDDAAAADAFSGALDCWRGQPLPDDDGPDLHAVRAALADVRREARRGRAQARLGRGDPTGALADLDRLVLEDVSAPGAPPREDVALLRLRALATSGRPADALALYDVVRRDLADTLGTDPSPALQEAYRELLVGADRAAPRTNLRVAVTSFVGREADVAAVDETLARGTRLVTLVGPGGAGKTRLAAEVAARWADRSPDGVWFVELAPVAEAEGVDAAVLDGIGALDMLSLDQRPERRRSEGRARVLELLADARCVVVLDNCEHLVDAAADLAADLLGRCPGVRLLATSREALGVDGEQLHPLASLGMPAAPVPEQVWDADLVAVTSATPSVRLLLDRAAAAGATVELDDETWPCVVEVVRRLDGLPLAIELAAARLRVMSVAEVAARLGDRFRLLTGGRRTAVARHRTLRAVVEWSWDLLSAPEREVAERFGVLAAGGTAETVAAVCPSFDDASVELEDVLHQLVDKSILVAEPAADGTRFRMLETLREYGSERLALAGTLEETRLAHAHHFAALAAHLDPLLRTRDQLTALRRFEAERENLTAALAFLCERGDGPAAVTMLLDLTWHWLLRENSQDAERWSRAVVVLPGAADSPEFALVEGMTLMGSAVMAGGPSDPADLPALLHDLVDRLPPQGRQVLPFLRAILLFLAEDLPGMSLVLEANLESPDPWVRAATRSLRVTFAENEGQLGLMRDELAEAVLAWEALGDHWGLANTLTSRAQLRSLEGDLDGSLRDLTAAVDHIRLLGASGEDVMATMRLADLRLRAGDVDGAEQYARLLRSDPRFRRSGRGVDMFSVLLDVRVAVARGDEAAVAAGRATVVHMLDAAGEPGSFRTHMSAVAQAMLAQLAVREGDLPEALARSRTAHRLGVATADLPILATVGVATAGVHRLAGRPRDAVRVLGASHRLRGAADATEPTLAALVTALRGGLGDDYDPAYAEGLALGRDEAVAATDPDVVWSGPVGSVGAGQARRR